MAPSASAAPAIRRRLPDPSLVLDRRRAERFGKNHPGALRRIDRLTGALPEFSFNPDDIARSLREQMRAATELEIVRPHRRNPMDGSIGRSWRGDPSCRNRAVQRQVSLPRDRGAGRRTSDSGWSSSPCGPRPCMLPASPTGWSRAGMMCRRIGSWRGGSAAHAAFGWFAARAHRGLLIDNTSRPRSRDQHPDPGRREAWMAKRRWQVLPPDLCPDLTASL